MIDPKIQEMVDMATDDIKRLRAADTCADARKAWIAFLENSNRALNRLEAAAKEVNQAAKYKAVMREIRAARFGGPRLGSASAGWASVIARLTLPVTGVEVIGFKQ